MKNRLAEIKQWPKRAMDRIAIWCMTFAVKKRPNLVMSHIMEKANELGVMTTMHILDREGIAHCHRCPQRFSLRRVGQGYACLNHIPKREEVKAGGQPATATA